MLRQLAPGLWVAEQPLRFAGLEVGTRMTAVRLPDGDLLLHSPIAPGPDLQEQLNANGRVRYLIAPNRFHHLFVGDYLSVYPEARIFAAPGVEKKRPELPIESVLGDEAPAAWSGSLEQRLFRGFPLANEVAFFHPATQTLILSDLAFHVGPDSPFLTRLAFRLLGAYGRFGPSLLERVAIRDRASARDSLNQILAWDFDRVIVAHGQVLEHGGGQALRDGYRWLL